MHAQSTGLATSVISADGIYLEGRIQEQLGLALDARGRIVLIAPLGQLQGLPHVHKAGKVLFPGFVNTHSHAFQRLIRGRTSAVPSHDRRADFWSWREQMYRVANELLPEEVQAVSALCYLEMLKAGITSVAEFHYLHHDRNGHPYDERNLLAHQVLSAGEAVGLRVTLMPVAYHTSGFGQPAKPEQCRFVSPDPETFMAQVESLSAQVKAGRWSGAQVAMAVHSVRAVPERWLKPLKQFARQQRMPIHIHANEQLAEVRQSVSATGVPPVLLLARQAFLDESTVLVHATHVSAAEKAALREARAQVSVCPTTERDLGDGICEASRLDQLGISLSLGSDSHVQLDFFEEMRCLEGHERLRQHRRNVLLAEEPSSQSLTVGPLLWRMATEHGADAISQPVGRFEVGRLADAFTVDRNALELEGARLEELPELLWVAGSNACIRDVCVGGQWRIEEGQHPAEASIRAAYRQVCRRLFV
ncbi:MAG: formimidoylglutamate deiminase [Myxococcota bacterium]